MNIESLSFNPRLHKLNGVRRSCLGPRPFLGRVVLKFRRTTFSETDSHRQPGDCGAFASLHRAHMSHEMDFSVVTAGMLAKSFLYFRHHATRKLGNSRIPGPASSVNNLALFQTISISLLS